jgi:trimeric autotransporter adhesin
MKRALKSPVRKRVQTRSSPPSRLKPIACCVMLALCNQVVANPTGPQVVNGSAQFQGLGTSNLKVTNSSNAIINWQGFSIPGGSITQFAQQSASSAVLNRVVGADISQIQGQLLSNGRVFLINPAGIVIGAGAVIDTAGFVGSTLQMLDGDFLAGKLKFSGDAKSGAIINHGWIRAGSGGNVVLVAPSIENSGVIQTDGGQIVLAAGQKLTIGSLDYEGVQFEIQAPTDSALNIGKLLADGGAVGVFAGTLKHSGDIRANALTRDEAGRVVLKAQGDVTVAAGSTITADGKTGGAITFQSTNGTTLVSGNVTAQGSDGKGGDIRVLGERVGVIEQALLDVSGTSGGGQILIGGDYRGENSSVQNAAGTFVGVDTTLRADALTSGDGGKLIVWSENSTRAYGAMSARGGAQWGNGGFVETSGHYLDVLSRPDVSAPNGRGGTWLLDPFNITITAATTTNNTGTPDFTPTGNDSQVSAAAIATRLEGNNNVTIDTSGGGTQAGNITVASGITTTTAGAGATLTLNADGTVNVNAPIDVPLHHVVITAGRAVGSAGGVNLNNVGGVVIRTGSGGVNPAADVTITATRGDIFFNQGSNVAISSPGDSTNGDGIVTLTATAGAIRNQNLPSQIAVERASALNITARDGLSAVTGDAFLADVSAVSINTTNANFNFANNSAFTVNASNAGNADLFFSTRNADDALTVAGAVTGRSISLTGDQVTVSADVTGTSNVGVSTFSLARAIALENAADSIGTGATMRVDLGELNRFVTPRLTVGNVLNTGGLVVAENVNPSNLLAGTGSLGLFAGSPITQTGGAIITVPRLEAMGTSVVLNNVNSVGRIAGQATGLNQPFTFQNGAALDVQTVASVAGISTNNGNVTLANAGPMSITSNINAGTGTVALTTSGAGNAITQTAASTNAITAGTLTLTTADANATLNRATNAIINLGATNLGTGALNLLDAGGLTVTGTVGATGGVALNTSGPLTINNTVNAGGFFGGGTVSLATTGSGNAITQNAAGKITANTLTLSTVDGNVTLNTATGGNPIANLGTTSLGTGALDLFTDGSTGGLTVTGPVAATGGITLSTIGSISVENTLNAGAGNVSLNAFNVSSLFSTTFISTPQSISQTAAGAITAGTLTLQAGSGVSLDQAPNVITNLGTSTVSIGGATFTTSSPLSLTNTRDLTITGAVEAGSIAITAAGRQILDGGAAGRLDTTDAVMANGDTGAITLSAGTIGSALAPLSVNAGAFTPTGTNIVTATSTIGGAFLDQSAGNAVTSGYAFNVPLGQTIGLSTTNGTITVDGPFGAAGRNVSLGTAGGLANTITQTATGVITADTLSLTTADADATLNTATNALTNLGPVALGTGALDLLDAGGLSITGAVAAGGGIAINTSGALTVNNTVDAGLAGVSLTTSAGGNITLNDAIVSGSVIVLEAPGAQITDAASTGRLVSTTSLRGASSIALNAATIGAAGDGLGVTPLANTVVQATSTGSAFLDQTTGNVLTSKYTFVGQLPGSTLGLSAANGSISVDAPFGAAGLNVSLATAGGAANTIAQTSLGVITADTLTLATANANATLNSVTNAITNLGTVNLGTGALNLLDAGGLTVTGAIAASGGVTLDTSGALGVNNTINAGAGNVTLATTGIGNAISQTAAGTIAADTLTLTTTNANATLNATPNAITNLGAVTLGAGALNLLDVGGLTVTGAVAASSGVTLNTSGALVLNNVLNAGPGSVSLTTTGSGNAMSQSVNGVITAGTLALTTTDANATFNTATNAITNLGAVTLGAGALTLLDAGGLAVAGAVAANGGVTLNTSGPLALNNTMNAGTGNVSLTTTGAGNAVTQGPSGAVTADTLTLTTSNASATLSGATNALTNLGAVTLGTGALDMLDAGGLAVTAVIAASGGMTLNTSGALAVNNALNAGTGSVTLTTTGGGANTISQNAAGVITADTLALTTTNANAILNSATNAVTNLGTVSLGAGALNLLDAGGLTVTGAVAASGGITLNTSGALAVNNTVNAGTGDVTLTTSGGALNAIGQNAAGVITANTLTLTTANAGATLNAATNALTNLGTVTLGTGALNLLDAGGLAVTGAVTLGGASLNTSGALAVNNTINAGAGTVLLATTGGAANTISQTGAGVITADTVALTTTNANVALDTAVNAVTNLGPVGLGTGALNVLDAGGLTVTGAVAASGGATLNTSGALAVNNAINAGPGNVSLTTTGAGNAVTQNLNGAITAGTLTLATTNANATLNGATNAITNLGPISLGTGALNVLDAGGLTVAGAIAAGGITLSTSGPLAVNNILNAGAGSIALTTSTAGSSVSFADGVTVDGASLTVDTSAANANATIASGTVTFNAPVTVGANVTTQISGTADVVANAATTLNGALAWSGGTLRGAGAVTVPGTTSVTGGTPQLATTLSTVTLNETAGALTVTPSGIFNITGAGTSTLAGSLTNNGTLNLNAGTLALAGASGALTNNSTFNIGASAVNVTGNGTQLVTNAGTLNSDGSHQIIGLGGGARFHNTGSVNVAGGALTLAMNDVDGSLAGSGPLGDAGAYNMSAGSTLIFSNANRDLLGTSTVTGAGNVLFTSTVGGTFNLLGSYTPGGNTTVQGNTTVNFLGATTMPSLTMTGGTLSVGNGGTLNLTGGGSTTITGGTLKNFGALNVQGGNVELNNAFPTNNGALNISTGAILATTSDLTNASGGIISGTGTLSLGGNTLINSGTVSPGASPGTLVINGNYTQSPTGTLAIELGGTQQGVTYDLLQITGTAQLDGTLNVTTVNGFTPSFGSVFDFMTFSNRIGDFAAINLPAGSVLQPFGSTSFYELFMSPPIFVFIDAINPVIAEREQVVQHTLPEVAIEEPKFRPRLTHECT